MKRASHAPPRNHEAAAHEAQHPLGRADLSFRGRPLSCCSRCDGGDDDDADSCGAVTGARRRDDSIHMCRDKPVGDGLTHAVSSMNTWPLPPVAPTHPHPPVIVIASIRAAGVRVRTQRAAAGRSFAIRVAVHLSRAGV